MIKKTLILAGLAIMAIAAATPAAAALAARRDAGLFSVELPAGWDYSDSDPVHLFSHESDGLTLFKLTIANSQVLSLEEFAESEAEGYPVKMSPDGRSFVYQVGYNEGARGWGIEADGGTFVEISTFAAAAADLPAFLAGLRANEGQDALAGAFEAANGQEVVEWLAFEAPYFLDAELGLTLFSGHGLTAKLPPGWKATAGDDAVEFSFPDEKAYGSIIARVVSLPDAEYSTFLNHAKDLMRQMGGTAFMEGESGVEFTLEDGGIVIFTSFRGHGLVQVVRSPETEDEEANNAFSLLLNSISVSK